MISTSGSKLIDDEAKEAIIQHIFPFVDLVTPNKFEAEELLGGDAFQSMNDVEQGRSILCSIYKILLTSGVGMLISLNKM